MASSQPEVVTQEPEVEEVAATPVEQQEAPAEAVEEPVVAEVPVAAEDGIGEEEEQTPKTTTLPTDTELQAAIASVIKGCDINTLKLGQTRAAVETALGLASGALDDDKARVGKFCTEEIARIQQERVDQGAAAEGTPQKDGKRALEEESTPQPAMKRRQFNKTVGDLEFQVGDQIVKVPAKNFSSGSSGFYTLAKVPLKVGDQEFMMQCQIHCAILGSKEWEK